MKKLISIRILVFVFIVLFVLGQNAFAAEKLTKITDGVYSYVATKNSAPQNSYGANAGIIIGRDGIVIVDTLISSKEAKRFIKDIRKITKKPIKYVVNTHYHLDHTFGNSEFANLGAVIISHTSDSKNLKTHGEEVLKNVKNYGLTEKDMKGTKLAYPALSFNDRMEIDLGDKRIELLYTGHSHTDGSIMVYLPDTKVLFAGDILFTGYHPFIGDGSMEEWMKALDFIMAMGVEKIVPGHGPVSTKTDIEDMKNYLIAFESKAKELASESNDAEYISSEILKFLPQRAEGTGLILWNIQMKYLKK